MAGSGDRRHVDLKPHARHYRKMSKGMRVHMKHNTTRAAALAGLTLIGLSACVKVQAPDKPIEINLNVNIKQEVVIRLEKDVRDLIKNNPAVF